MSKRLLCFLPLLFLTNGFADEEGGGPDISNWSITIKGGPAYPVMGEFTGSTAEQTTTTTDPDGNEVITGNAANIQALSWDDAYEDFLDLAVEVDFWEDATRSLYLGISHTRATGKTTSLGSFNGSQLTATFSDYSDTGIYAGFRWGLGEGSWIKSLISVQAGGAMVDNIEANVTSIPNVSQIPLYKQTTVFSGGVFLSVIITPLDFFEIGIESGLRYQTAPKADDSQVSLLGLEGINSEGKLGLVPVRILATFKF